jgi:hypothetical protein
MNLPIQPIQPKTIGGQVVFGLKPVAVTISGVQTQVVVSFFGDDALASAVPLSSFDITPEEYSAWGIDDGYLIDLACSKLDCVKA